MTRNNPHRRNIIIAAQRLLRRQGYTATGINDIIAKSGAPKGSLYYYFPEGKEQIAVAAIEGAGGLVADTFRDLAEKASGPADFIRNYLTLLGQWLEMSGYRDGCPIATTLLETVPDSSAITAAGRDVLDDWRRILADMLIRHGADENTAPADANLIMSAIEGAMLLARTEQSTKPLQDVADRLSRLYD